MPLEPLFLVTCLGFCYLAKTPVVPGSAGTVPAGVERLHDVNNCFDMWNSPSRERQTFWESPSSAEQ